MQKEIIIEVINSPVHRKELEYFCFASHLQDRSSQKHSSISCNQILVHSGIFWDILGHSGTFWDILEHSGTFWGILGYSGKFWDILEQSGTFWDILGHSGTFWDVPWIFLGYSGIFCDTLSITQYTTKSSNLFVLPVIFRIEAAKNVVQLHAVHLAQHVSLAYFFPVSV